jgi:hypothetical protein
MADVPLRMPDSPHLCAAESATHASGTEPVLAATHASGTEPVLAATHASGTEPVLAATHASSEPEPAATQACTDQSRPHRVLIRTFPPLACRMRRSSSSLEF